MQEQTRWHSFPSAQAVADKTLELILAQAQQAINERGQFKIVLAGGTTPKKVYQLLARQTQDWSKWLLFLGDERCLEAQDQERNSVMIEQNWLSEVDFPKSNVFMINAHLGPETAAKEYAQHIEPYLPFDVTLLGMGEDGHTASLFPGHEHNENELAHAVYNSPKPPPERVSLSQKALAQSEHLYILVTGSGKKEAVQQWQQRSPLPIAQVQALNGVDVLIDQDAQP